MVFPVLLDESGEVLDGARAAVEDGRVLAAGGEELNGGVGGVFGVEGCELFVFGGETVLSC